MWKTEKEFLRQFKRIGKSCNECGSCESCGGCGGCEVPPPLNQE